MIDSQNGSTHYEPSGKRILIGIAVGCACIAFLLWVWQTSTNILAQWQRINPTTFLVSLAVGGLIMCLFIWGLIELTFYGRRRHVEARQMELGLRPVPDGMTLLPARTTATQTSVMQDPILQKLMAARGDKAAINAALEGTTHDERIALLRQLADTQNAVTGMNTRIAMRAEEPYQPLQASRQPAPVTHRQQPSKADWMR